MDGTEKNDEELLYQIKSGDERAFKILFLRYYQRLCNFAFTYVNCIHRSEEIVQDVFGHFWEVKTEIDPSENLRAYLFVSVKNKALDRIKKKKTEEKYIDLFAIDKRTNIYQDRITKGNQEFRSEVQKAINNLPKKAKRIYFLSRKEGLTYKEIANFLDISVKTVESQMTRSLKKLRDHLHKFISILLAISQLPI